MKRWLKTAIFTALYILIVVSPLPREVGRNHPVIAAWLSPPFFVFGETYEAGSVLDIPIGGSREEVADVLDQMGLAALLFDSGLPLTDRTVANSHVIFSNKGELLKWGESQYVWSIINMKWRYSLLIFFENGSVSKIDLAKSYFEAF